MCPTLKVHGTVMNEVTEETYLGDIISNDGKNHKNIKHRMSKGIGIITQISNLLDMISFGPYLIEIALLLRDSMLINGILTNVEVWYNLTTNDIKEFENLDKTFLRKVLGVPGSTPSEAFYLELGILPVGTIIKARRLNYLHTILTGDKNGMLYAFFITQRHNPTRGDWTEQVKVDLEDFDIPCSFEYIEKKSKNAFKRIVKMKAKEHAMKRLISKQETHSKMENLKYTELKIQNYFKDENLKPKEMKTIFRYRTRMEMFGENFRGGEDQVVCPLCKLHLDNQELSLQCPVIRKEIEVKGKLADIYKENISYDIIKTVSKISEYRRDNNE